MQARATEFLYHLIGFGINKELIDEADRKYTLNRLLEIMHMDAPEAIDYSEEACPVSATKYIDALLDAACEAGLFEDSDEQRDLFAAKLMGELTPHPAAIRSKFQALYAQSPSAATKWFYQLCRDVDYIRVDRIAKNVRYFADSPCGKLEITINLSKPEKDPRDIVAQGKSKNISYPMCMLCTENPGYAGRIGFPARQNHRIIPLKLNGDDWYMQYSPYLYYNEHCIVLNGKHVPMRISRDTFVRLFDFVSQFPHYFLGSNADLPIVGGSILSHDHFQGGNYMFPMDKAPVRIALKAPVAGIEAQIVDWPMTCIRLVGEDKDALIDLADQVLTAWRGYTDEACNIYAHTNAPHNTITPILRNIDGKYHFSLVLRNNRTDDKHPLGIFHPNNALHHIKKENIGLIEVMGLFILPGRLLNELTELAGYLTGELPLGIAPASDSPLLQHYNWICEIARSTGTGLTNEQAIGQLQRALAAKCANVLEDAGVYKRDDEGAAGILRFMQSIGYAKMT